MLGIQGGYIIAVFVGRPYKRLVDYGRFGVIELTLLLLFVIRLIEANVVTDFGQVEAGIGSFIEIGSLVVIAGMLAGLVMSLIAFAFHLWKARTQDGQVAPEPEAE